ncbi:type II toxin-antitoxin system death-on-curing family toxin [Lactobacillus helveticus]|uniref:type II toxin-antitoxin system death-on-curing family toxin n=1 Tax=Lactobacillus helveticus TaxID=1587 RepID=UPI001C64B8F7|nr:type II toxin-antitoxin system death-on-curing family toxin [Lactobacillus helveticus]MBW7986650.1 type II toxin-antitoxin system death-on-curing family toxin [Lactobacillus helveticus]
MIYLTKTDLIHLNQRLLEKAGKGIIGVQYPEGLDIVAQQPQQILFGRELYPTLWLKAAFILQKITKKHIFADGNKRTSYYAAAFFLQENGYHLKADKDDALKFILYITNSEDSEDNMRFAADWLKVHSVKTK